MSKPTRENAFNALFALAKTVVPPTATTWKTTSRKLRHWDDVPTASQPALFVHKGPEDITEPNLGLHNYKWNASIWIYFRADVVSTGISPDTVINQMLDAFDATFESQPPGERQTLGNVIYNCCIEGQVHVDAGIVDNQCVVVIPVVLTTGI